MAKSKQPKQKDDPRSNPAHRPEGSPNKSYDSAIANPSRCRCGSTERVPYFGKTIEYKITGLDDAGNPYTHVVYRRTKCQACGQVRKDRSYENRIRK